MGGEIQACSLTNKELMDTIRAPWEFAFKKGNCLKAWEVTGVVPFTLRVEHELRAEEKVKGKTVRVANAQLNWKEFTAEKVFPQARSGRELLEAETGERFTEEEAAAINSTRLGSSVLFKLKGGVTGPLA
eukprot:3774694-Rhodomonas_salina.1